MDANIATALLRMQKYPLEVFPGFAWDQDDRVRFSGTNLDAGREQLAVSKLVLHLPKAPLSIWELTDGRAVAMWDEHGYLFGSITEMRDVCRFAFATGNNYVRSPLNNYEFTRLEIAFE